MPQRLSARVCAHQVNEHIKTLWFQSRESFLCARAALYSRLLVSGKLNKEIAVELEVSEKSVEKYLGELFKKMGVTTRVEAAVKAVREGLV